MNSLLLFTIILIVLGSCLPPCQNVEEEKKDEVLERDDSKNLLLRLIREADGIKAEDISERAKEAPKEKSKSVSKKSVAKKNGSDDKLKKKLTKKHGNIMKTHKVITINTTTSLGNDSAAHGLDRDIKNINSAKNISSLAEGAEKNSSKVVKGDSDSNVFNQSDSSHSGTGHISGSHIGSISGGSHVGSNSAKNISSSTIGTEKNSSKIVKGDSDSNVFNQSNSSHSGTGHTNGSHIGSISGGSFFGSTSGGSHDGLISSGSKGISSEDEELPSLAQQISDYGVISGSHSGSGNVSGSHIGSTSEESQFGSNLTKNISSSTVGTEKNSSKIVKGESDSDVFNQSDSSHAGKGHMSGSHIGSTSNKSHVGSTSGESHDGLISSGLPSIAQQIADYGMISGSQSGSTSGISHVGSNSVKNISSLTDGAEKNSSKIMKGVSDSDVFNQSDSSHAGKGHTSGSHVGSTSSESHDRLISNGSKGIPREVLDVISGSHGGSISADADDKDKNDKDISLVTSTGQAHHVGNTSSAISKGMGKGSGKGIKSEGEKGNKTVVTKDDKAEGDSKNGNKHKPVNVAVDHSDGAKKGDSGSQKDSSDGDSTADSGPKVNMTANDDSTNITASLRSSWGEYRISPMKLKQKIL